MSKKEQKLKKNLYKALTEYFIHNPKNSLTSSESILDQLASFCMETGLPAALRQDKKYQKAQKKCNKANEKIRDLNLTPQQWDTVDAAITAENISSIEYIRIAYKQGIIDAFSILRETLQYIHVNPITCKQWSRDLSLLSHFLLYCFRNSDQAKSP